MGGQEDEEGVRAGGKRGGMGYLEEGRAATVTKLAVLRGSCVWSALVGGGACLQGGIVQRTGQCWRGGLKLGEPCRGDSCHTLCICWGPWGALLAEMREKMKGALVSTEGWWFELVFGQTRQTSGSLGLFHWAIGLVKAIRVAS